MTFSTDDIHYPSSEFQAPVEYVVFILLILLHLGMDGILVQLVRGKLLEINSITWRLSMALMITCFLRMTVCVVVLYVDCPKVVSLCYAILGGIITNLFVVGLAQVLKQGFCNDSKYLTTKRVTIWQYVSLGMHIVLIGPYYFLLVRYPIEKTPFSIKTFQLMYQFNVIVAYVYVIWQYFYMAYYLKAFFDQMDSVLSPQNSRKKTDALRNAKGLIIAALVVCGLGLIIWLYSYTLSGLNSQLAFYLGQGFIMFMSGFAVMLFAELRSTSKKVAASSSGGGSKGKSAGTAQASTSSATMVKSV